MKSYFYIIVIFFVLLHSCSTQHSTASTETPTRLENDTIRIANEEVEYEITIIDVGFSSWFNSYAKPKGYYSQNYLESRNQIWVTEWNRRVLLPQQYNPNWYEMQIDYNPNTNYGYDVNYMLYNYLVYFQLTNKQQLGGFTPRI